MPGPARECYVGGCHCGALGWRFYTDREPSDWAVRACQCGFCRAHGVQVTSDPEGTVEFFAAVPGALSRYRFGRHTADFLVCARCGVYLGAVTQTPQGAYATLNVNAMRFPPPGLPEAKSISYDGESREQKSRRRALRWTPVTTGI